MAYFFLTWKILEMKYVQSTEILAVQSNLAIVNTSIL